MAIDAIRLAPPDNVAVLVRDVAAGDEVRVDGLTFHVGRGIGLGHKIAVRSIARGDRIVKHGMPIGSATGDIQPGEHVHVHNMRSDYLPTSTRADGRRTGDGR